MGCATAAGVAAVIVLSFAVLLWAGALQWLGVGIQREVTVQSQQYITAHNQQILAWIADYMATNDPARKQAIVNQVCLAASEIPGHVTPTAQPFVAAHC